MSKKLAIAMFGQKRLSREGGVEIVVKELCTRMAQNGCDVTCCAIRVHSSFTTISTPPSLDHLLWPKTASLNFSFIFPFPSLSPFRDLIPIPCQTPARFPLHHKKPGRIYAQVFD